MPIGAWNIAEAIKQEYYTCEKNGLMDDIYSKYEQKGASIEDKIKKCAGHIDRLIKQNQAPDNDWGEKRKKMPITMLCDVYFNNGTNTMRLTGGAGMRKYGNERNYTMGAKRAMDLVELGYAEINDNNERAEKKPRPKSKYVEVANRSNKFYLFQK